ncbi:MAG: MarR family transcriptional regulator [Actinobacteria bacterium]|uniref:MarR family transcriptional regulator n=1 Tax=Candidatus Fonsibacter lacus TaxID=2576439 RepID=A0A965LLE3_9PROT|nr:MarR family transcriptional regulator [Candidatus Fonsibacter lacus]
MPARAITARPTSHSQLTKDELEAWRSYISTTRALTTALDIDLGEFGISLADFELLDGLANAPESRMRMSELAEIALVSRSRLSHRMKVLEEQGWVARARCSEDKRGLFAVLTPKGKKLVTKIGPRISPYRARAIGANYYEFMLLF